MKIKNLRKLLPRKLQYYFEKYLVLNVSIFSTRIMIQYPVFRFKPNLAKVDVNSLYYLKLSSFPVSLTTFLSIQKASYDLLKHRWTYDFSEYRFSLLFKKKKKKS